MNLKTEFFQMYAEKHNHCLLISYCCYQFLKLKAFIITKLYLHMANLITLVVLLIAVSSVHSKLTIQAPPDLAAHFNNKYGKEGIPYSIANYGIVPYSKTISGSIGTPSVLEDCVFEDLSEQTNTKPILLIERNDCTFTQKSINAQREGAKLAIIMDNQVEDPGSVVMVDDGRANLVTIPTILISQEDGSKILQALLKQNVITSVSFEVPTRAQSEVELWIDIAEHKNFIFLRELQPYYNKIKSHVKLDIAYHTRKCSNEYCKDSDCFYNKSYCRTDYKFWGVENKGQIIIKEQLRQYFIFQLFPAIWWDYVLMYDQSCIDLAELQSCSAKIMKKLSINQAAVNEAVEKSFGQDDNQILREFSERKYNSSIIYFPSVVVNSMVYRGNLQPFEVFEVICDSLSPQPEECTGLTTQDNGLSTWIGVVIIGVIAFGIFLIICFRRIARREVASKINQQVNELVNQYITMYQNDRFEQGSQLPPRKTSTNEN